MADGPQAPAAHRLRISRTRPPFGIAPTGAAGLYGFEADIALARAAEAAGVPFVLSTASFVSMERVARAAGGRIVSKNLSEFRARREALDLLKSEVDRVMALLGCRRIEDRGPEYLELPDALRA